MYTCTAIGRQFKYHGNPAKSVQSLLTSAGETCRHNRRDVRAVETRAVDLLVADVRPVEPLSVVVIVDGDGVVESAHDRRETIVVQPEATNVDAIGEQDLDVSA